MAGRVLLGPERDVAGRLLLRPKRDVAGRVLLGPERDVAGRVLLGPERDVAGRVLLGPERDVAGRLLLRPKRDVYVAGAELVGRGSEEVGVTNVATTWWNNDHRRKNLLEQKIDKIEDEMSPRGERQGGNGERERVKLTALVPVPV